MKKETFESALAALEKTVEELEQGDLPLDTALSRFEAGVKKLAVCRKYLEDAENKVEILLKDQGGALRTEPFEPENNG